MGSPSLQILLGQAVGYAALDQANHRRCSRNHIWVLACHWTPGSSFVRNEKRKKKKAWRMMSRLNQSHTEERERERERRISIYIHMCTDLAFPLHVLGLLLYRSHARTSFTTPI